MAGKAAEAYVVLRADGSLLPRDVKRYASAAGENAGESYADKFDETLSKEAGRTLKNFTGRLSKAIENVDFSGLQRKSEAYTDTVRRLTAEVGELYDNHVISRKAADAYLDSIGDWGKRQQMIAGYNRVIAEQNRHWKEAKKGSEAYRKSVTGLGDQLADFETKYRAALDPKIMRAFVNPGGWNQFIKQVGDASKASKILSDRMDELVEADSRFAAQRDEVMASFQAHVDGAEAAAKSAEKSKRRLKAFKNTVGGVTGAMKRMTKSFHNFITSSQVFEPTIAKIGLGLLTLSSMIPSIFDMVGAIGLLPGVLTVAGAAAATLAVGFRGMGNALSNMDDLEAFNEALKGLAPSAQNFARAVRGVRGEWSAMAESVQQNLFAGLASQFTALSNTYLPIVQTGFEDIANSANDTAKRISQALREASSTQSVELALESTEVAVERLGKGFAEAIPGLLQLSAESARVFAEMSDGADEVGRRFSEFIDKVVSDGSFAQWVKDGVTAVGNLASSFGSIISILNGIGEAAERAGGPTLGSVADGLEGIAEAVNSPGFQKGATQFFSDLYDGLDGVMSALPDAKQAAGDFFSVLGTASEQYGPGIGNIISGISKSFSELAPSLEGAIKAMGPGFRAMTSMFSNVMPKIAKALGPIIESIAETVGPMVEKLAPKIGEIGKAFADLLTALQPVVSGILAVLGPVVSFISGILLGAVKGAIEGITQFINGLVDVFKGLGKFFSNFGSDWGAAWEGLKQAAMGVWDMIVGALKTWLNVTILSVFRKGLLALLKNWKSVWNKVKAFGAKVWNGIKAALMAAWNGIKAAGMAVWNGLKAFFKGLWNGIKAVAVAAWNGLKASLLAVWNGIKAAAMAAWNGLKSFFMTFWNGIKAVFTTAWNVIKAQLLLVWNTIKTVAMTVWNSLKAFFTTFWNGVKAIFATAWNVIKSQLLLVWNVIKTSAIAVWNGLKAFFTTFWNGVKAVFTVAWNTIKTTLTTVWNSIKAVATTVWNGIKAFFTQWWAGVQATFRVAVALVKSVVSKAWNAIKSVTSSVWNGIKSVITTVWNTIKSLVTSAVARVKSSITNAWNRIKSLTSSVWNGIKSVISSVWNGIKSFVSSAVSRVKSVVTSAWNRLKSLTSSVWNGIKSVISSVWSGIKSLIRSAVSTVKSVITSAWNRVKSLTSSVWNGIKNLIRSAWNTIKSLIRSAISSVRSVVSSGWNRVKSLTSSAFNRMKSIVSNAWNSIRSAVSSGISRVVSLVRGLPGKIKSALGNLGNLLKNAGKQVIQGLINGIQSKVGALKGKLGNITSKIKNWKGPYDTDKRLLTPAGEAIMSGLMDGIDKQVPALRKMLGEVTDEIEGTTIGMPTLRGRRIGATPVTSSFPRRSISSLADGARYVGGSTVDNRSTRSTTVAPGAIQINAPYTDPQLAANRVLDGIVNDL